MDNLTHTLTGLMLSRAGLNRLSPHASLLAVVAVNLPDVDMVTLLAGGLTNLEHHRGITHSLFAVPLMAAVPVALVAALRRTRLPWLQAWLVSVVALLSHLLLDWTNTYGIRLLTPWRDTMYRLDITFVYDLWVWVFLGLAVAGPLLSRLVSGEIGAKPSRGQGAAIAALLAFLAYDALRYTLHARMVEQLQSRIYPTGAPRRVAALPSPVSPILWTGVVETESAWSIHALHALQEFDPTEGSALRKPLPSAAIDAAARTSTVRRYLTFSQLPYWRAVPLADPQGATRIQIVDLRFGQPPEAERFVVTVDVDERGRVLEEGFHF